MVLLLQPRARMKHNLINVAPPELAKGQFWKTALGLIQIVDLGKSLVYYRVSRNPGAATFTRMLRREAFQQQLNATAATLVG